jgi:hypothetical protein
METDREKYDEMKGLIEKIGSGVIDRQSSGTIVTAKRCEGSTVGRLSSQGEINVEYDFTRSLGLILPARFEKNLQHHQIPHKKNMSMEEAAKKAREYSSSLLSTVEIIESGNID